MCRSIKNLRRVEEPVTTDDVRAAARQYVRKISGYQHPPKYRTELFERAVDEVASASQRLVDAMELSVK
jgi:hypothetical protein